MHLLIFPDWYAKYDHIKMPPKAYLLHTYQVFFWRTSAKLDLSGINNHQLDWTDCYTHLKWTRPDPNCFAILFYTCNKIYHVYHNLKWPKVESKWPYISVLLVIYGQKVSDGEMYQCDKGAKQRSDNIYISVWKHCTFCSQIVE